MPEKLSLHRKLAQIMYEAERIPKNGRAPREMGGYPFVQVGDAADFIRKALAEKVLTMMPTQVRVVGSVDRPTKAGGSTTTVDLVTSWTITDGESGESITIESFGAGADVGDKYSGKASTSAMKYALLTGFLLSTGEDSEGGRLPEGGAPSEVAKADAANVTRTRAAADEPVPLGPLTVTGRIVLGRKPQNDGLLRATPDGNALGLSFSDGNGKSIPQVVVRDRLAVDLYDATSLGSELAGLEATLSGDLYSVPWWKDGKQMRPFQRLELARIETKEWTLPVPDFDKEQTALFEERPEEAEFDKIAETLP